MGRSRAGWEQVVSRHRHCSETFHTDPSATSDWSVTGHLLHQASCHWPDSGLLIPSAPPPSGPRTSWLPTRAACWGPSLPRGPGPSPQPSPYGLGPSEAFLMLRAPV